MQPITIAKMVPLHNSTPVLLPPEFVEKSIGEARSALLILTSHSQIIRLIPTQSPLGVKVVVGTSELSSDFFLEIEQIFSRNKLKSLYCTGLCLTQDACTYESYFDLSESSISENQLKEEISQLKGVYHVELFKLKA
ncbi:MAG: hypothetical protein ACFE9L_09180 [Candidatus Hodarchaeota archaeon]